MITFGNFKTLWLGLLLSFLPGGVAPQAAESETTAEYKLLQRQIADSKQWDRERLAKEVLRPESLILESDKTPADVVLRRTEALLSHLTSLPGAPDLKKEAKELQELGRQLVSGSDPAKLFGQITSLRRRIAFKNPLLDFNRIVFLKHNKQQRGEVHMVDQYLGFNAEARGGAYVLENPFGSKPMVRSLLKDAKVESGRLAGRKIDDHGSFISLELDYDAKSILFAYSEANPKLPEKLELENQRYPAEDYDQLVKESLKLAHYYWRPENCYHIFRANLDGSGLQQLTDGPYNEFDPVWLPSGRIGFISERNGAFCRCGARPLPSATLFSMMPDGKDIIQLSWHDTNEWQPSVDNSGMLVYTRWDYVDRDSDVAHHIWRCFPDGRDPRSNHGNYPELRESRPWMEMSIRAIPHSSRYVAVSTPHHGQAYGSMVLIDLNQKDDRSGSQLRRITPEVQFPESEILPGVPEPRGQSHPKGETAPVKPPARSVEVYGTPWPLSEDYYLCVYDPKGKNYGLYLMDSFGNRELLYRDPALACLDPIPLKARPRPPVVPGETLQAVADRPAGARQPAAPDQASGTVMVMNVYESDSAWPKQTKIKELRVVNIFPKPNSFADQPAVGYYAQSLARGVLGTVPVESDGSAYFRVPAGVGIYFQAIDENGLAVQTMRSDTYVHPGEKLSCAGCHEEKISAPPSVAQKPRLAMQRPPSVLKPEAEGSYPMTFPRLVQPVLDSKCVGCHDENQGKKKVLDLHGDKFVAKTGWSVAYNSLRNYSWGKSGGNGIIFHEGRQYSVPGEDGARVSPLYKLLAAGHHDVKLTPEELRRITLWLDCNSVFYGAYHDTEKQARGEVVEPRVGVPPWMKFAELKR